ncbi:peptidase dimerization domain-containing protein [Streptomyces sp. NPDC058818]|uniref:peptidase dimerization domain-containing protein n=1 Tax=Streptomyces sp. NPDC058818 TaxID=3346640 RepID=UPI00369601BD
MLAVSSWQVAYTGRTARAAVMPHEGVNAADATMIAQVAIGAYRQQMPPGGIVHGIVTSGGEAADVIPGRTTADYDCRAETADALRTLQDRIRAGFETGALATGAELTPDTVGNDYADLRQDAAMTELYRNAVSDLGRTVEPHDASMRAGAAQPPSRPAAQPPSRPGRGSRRAARRPPTGRGGGNVADGTCRRGGRHGRGGRG